jgi:hypothetical protein
MLKDFFDKLSRRRFGQALLASAGLLFGIRLLIQKGSRGMACHAPTKGAKISLREAEFYEVERRLL